MFLPFSLKDFSHRKYSKTRFAYTHLIQTPHDYGQFHLYQGKESPYIFS